jgi:hypothetical protein
MAEMRTVWKFPVELEPRSVIKMPAGAEILSAQFQRGKLTVWALVDPEAEETPRSFSVVGTGQPELGEITEPLRFIATVQYQGSIALIVMQLFEILAS